MVTAFIPARAGSERIKDKNIWDFYGHPLIAYTIDVAKRCKQISDVYVSSDSEKYLRIAEHYGAKAILRPKSFASSQSPDQEWIDHALEITNIDNFAILRPTNPFRTVNYLDRAIEMFYVHPEVAQVRAIEKAHQHPFKMWHITDAGMIEPYFETADKSYLRQTNTLPDVYYQNGSLEIRRSKPLTESILPILANGYEGFDINTVEDLLLADALIKSGIQNKPTIEGIKPWKQNHLSLV